MSAKIALSMELKAENKQWTGDPFVKLISDISLVLFGLY